MVADKTVYINTLTIAIDKSSIHTVDLHCNAIDFSNGHINY